MRPGYPTAAPKTAARAGCPPANWPSNTAWLELALVAADLTTWRQTTILAQEPDLARAEPKALRYRLLNRPGFVSG
jgi:hypothetical protein